MLHLCKFGKVSADGVSGDCMPCRKRNPDTFNAVAKVAWEYDFSIIWIKFDRPKDVSKDEYTDELSNKIFYLFK